MTRPLLLLVAAAHALSLAACATARPAPAADRGALQPFGGEEEFAAYERRRIQRVQRLNAEAPPPQMIIEHPSYYPTPSAAPQGPVQARTAMPETEARSSVQRPAVDEGAVVRVHGDFLVVLHRGRLFTVRAGDGALRPVSVVDAFGPGIDPLHRHEDLMVVGDRVVVTWLGHGSARLELFRVADDGRLTHRATYFLGSAGEDFNGSRRHASRLAGDRLVFYSPLHLEFHQQKAFNAFPWLFRMGGTPGVPHPAEPTRVYRPAPGHTGTSMHTVTGCELAAGDDLRCRSTGLYAPSGYPFHVSSTAVYVWGTRRERWWKDEREEPRHSVLYRMPLDGGAPTALRVSGRPLDDFAFLERDGHIHVLTRMDASDAMWGGEYAPGRLALLRVPLGELGDGSRAAPRERYRALPSPVQGGALHGRFVGDWLIYGYAFGPGSPRADSAVAYAAPLSGGGVSQVSLPHGVDRIEAMGSGAAVIGADGRDLQITTLRLRPEGVEPADRYTIPGPAQGWMLSHGFYYHPEGDDAGVLGLPLLGSSRPGAPLPTLGSARILFLRNQGLRLSALGELASADPAADDGCLASCTQWYANVRPLFAGGRVLALLGHEVVEGREEDGRIREVGRVDLTPAPPTTSIDGDWTFTETLGPTVGAYRCSHRGTMRLERTGDALTMRYRQTGECFVDDVAQSGDGEGSGTGTVTATGLTLRVNACDYRGRMRRSDEIVLFVTCAVPGPYNSTRPVEGHLHARRVQP